MRRALLLALPFAALVALPARAQAPGLAETTLHIEDSAEVTRAPDEVVVEFGGGTGAVTQAILESGVPPSKLYTVERDP